MKNILKDLKKNKDAEEKLIHEVHKNTSGDNHAKEGGGAAPSH